VSLIGPLSVVGLSLAALPGVDAAADAAAASAADSAVLEEVTVTANKLNYTRPIAGDWQGMLAADVTYRGAVNAYFASNQQFNLRLSPYALVGLRAGVINGPWSLTAFARNLTNKRAEVSAINSSQDPDALLTVRPRTIGLTVTRKF
jgi:TonB dependent receptor